MNDPILGQLLLAGQHSYNSPELNTLFKHRITEDSHLPPMEFLFKIFDVPCFPRRELVAVAGKAKSGKTFFLSLLMAASIRDNVMSIQRQSPPLRVLWYDTEQSQQSTEDILLNRIRPLILTGAGETTEESSEQIAPKDHIFAFNVRVFNWEQRLKMFEQAIPFLKPDLVILDGVRDLISDINDGREAQRITEQLMTLAQNNNCCIVGVLHQNKSDSDRNLRGWIGTELTNKVFEVYSCEKLRGSRTFKVEQTHTRKYELERDLYYIVDKETGLPESTDKPVTYEKPRDEQGRFISTRAVGANDIKWESFNRDYIICHDELPDRPYEWNLRKLFADALEGKSYKPYSVVMGIALKLTNIQDPRLYYALFDEAIQKRIILKETIPQTGQQIVRLYESQLPFTSPHTDAPF
ncbi:MAG: AAA family ATPase [Prevotella sp.]|nr:AAA family ATPase [Prevotella sp.]